MALENLAQTVRNAHPGASRAMFHAKHVLSFASNHFGISVPGTKGSTGMSSHSDTLVPVDERAGSIVSLGDSDEGEECTEEWVEDDEDGDVVCVMDGVTTSLADARRKLQDATLNDSAHVDCPTPTVQGETDGNHDQQRMSWMLG
eukprot:scaffold3158_cov389-Prasinococcus_capsulatus_cf.AAC.15